MRLLATLTAVATLAVAAPAHADWQWTKWGMSKDEVIAASGGRAAVDSEGDIRLSQKVTLAGQDFSVLFGFDDKGKLDSVFLEGDLSGYGRINGALAATFGAPVTKVGGTIEFLVFADQAKGNQIWLGRRTITTIIYRPLETGF